MLTKESLLNQFTDSLPAWHSKSTLYRYPRLISHFIDFIGAKQVYTKADAMRFLNHIINSGLSKNYASWSGYVLKQFYESLGLTFPLKAGDFPRPNEDEIVAPVFSADYVQNLIKVVRDKGTPQMKAYLALSTIYGFRRQELANITNKSMDNGIIHIPTVKGGAVREHSIPEDIAPYLASFKFKPVHPQTMTNLLLRVQLLAGLKHGERDGWHSLRRGLVTELMGLGLPISTVYSYMGWKLSSRLGIIGTYTRPNPLEVEKIILSHHPFIQSWR